MNLPVFSILHATKGRPEKARAARQMWLERASWAREPEDIEYTFAIDEGDVDPMVHGGVRHGLSRTVVAEAGNGSVAAWNAAAKASTGFVLIQAQDDIEPQDGWDHAIRSAVGVGNSRYWADHSFFMAVSDGYRKDELCCTAIMSRKYYEEKGEFLHAGYHSMFSDDEVTIRAVADGLDGKTRFIDARHLVFRHRHHYFDKSVPMDATYAAQNDPAHYGNGHELFMQRNGHLVARGLKTW